MAPDWCEARLRDWMPLFVPELVSREFTNHPHRGTLLSLAPADSRCIAFDPARTVSMAGRVTAIRHASVGGRSSCCSITATASASDSPGVTAQLLSPSIQSLMGRNGIGLLVLKAAALDCTWALIPWNDELFLETAEHISCPTVPSNRLLLRLQGMTF